MGSPSNEPGRWDNEAQVSVEITSGFEMQTTEITQYQWYAVMGDNPAYFKEKKHCSERGAYRNDEGGFRGCADYPVENVSWDQVHAFIDKLNSQDQKYKYRLPTEAEWEFAARGGTQTAYSFGDNVSDLKNYGWHWENSKQDKSDNQTHRVGLLGQNPLKLYDMHGNVWEWVEDRYAKVLEGGKNPTGPSSGSFRVFRGGSWFNGARLLRSAVRGDDWPSGRSRDLGARLVRTAK